MTPLPAVISKGGFKLTTVRRAGRAAIYRQHFPGANPDHDAYEVILPQVRNTNHKGQYVEPYEAYPAAESWGKKGWTFTSLAKAVQKLEELAQTASCRGTVSRRNGRPSKTIYQSRCSRPSPRRGTASRRNRFAGQGSLRGRLKARTSPLVPRQMFQTRVEPEVEISFAGIHCTPHRGPRQNDHSRHKR